jgi:hypothetical protein
MPSPGLLDGLVDVAAGPGLGRVELPEGALVGAEVGVREHLVLCRLLEVERGRQLVVLHVDELGGVAGLGRGPGHDHGDDLAGEGHPVDGDRRVGRGDLVGRDRPGVDQDALVVGDVLAAENTHDVGCGLGRAGVDADDPGVREGTAHHRQVHHPRQGQVVGPARATGDQPLVLLAAPLLADLGRGGGFGGGGHDCAPLWLAAWSTLLTMLW